MVASRLHLLLIAAVALHSAVVLGDAYEDCLNRKTREQIAETQELCWKQVEGQEGAFSDGAGQNAISCEEDAKKSFRVDDSVVEECMKLAKVPTPAPPHPAPPDPSELGQKEEKEKEKPSVPTPSIGQRSTIGKTVKPANRLSAKPNTNPSGSGIAPEAVDTAEVHASQDLNACLDAKSQASQCCNNPMSCTGSLSASDQMSLASLTQQMNNGPQPGQSIADYCSQMQQVSSSSGSVNNGLSAVCNSNQSSCTNTCSSLISKYQALVSNCEDCDASDVYSSTLSSLMAANSTCQSLRANVTAMAQQGLGSSSGQAYGSICQQQASLVGPNGMASQSINSPGRGPSQDPFGCAQNPTSAACQSCSTDPSSEACKALQSAAQTAATRKAGFQTASKKDGTSGFNTADLAAANANLNVNANASSQGAREQQSAATRDGSEQLWRGHSG